MASEVTRLSDVIVPEVFTQYIIEESINKNIFFRSGIMARDAQFDALVGGGGTTFNIPFWQQLSGDPQAIQSNTTIETKKASTSKQVARRFMWARGWSAEEIASALAGSNAVDAINSMVDDYWNTWFNKVIFSVIKGVIADNQDNDSGDLVNDITTTGTPGASNKMNSDSVIDTAALLGDRLDDFQGIAVHSVVYAQMKKNDLVDVIPDSQEGGVIETFMGMRLIIDDGLVPDTDGSNLVYWSILYRPSALAFGESANNITVFEEDRNAPASEDRIFTRRQHIMHPRGFKWIENSVVDDNPTQSEIEEAGNWDRVFEKKNCGFAVMKSNG
jgi:hypothetical protein